jgi:probable HAF family extracellular repeat protein
MAYIGGLGSDNYLSDANAEGSVAVGSTKTATGWQAYVYEHNTGAMTALGDLPGATVSSRGEAVSADGQVVVGRGSHSKVGENHYYNAFRWTQATGLVGLGDLAGGENQSSAHGISADGTTVVGYGSTFAGREACRWTQATGMVGLGDLLGGVFNSAAEDVSANGSVVVGYGSTSAGNEAFIWDTLNGMRNLKSVLESDYGLDLTGWQLNVAYAVSDDGKVLVGYGVNPSGYPEAWLATVPEPATVALLLTGGAALFMRRRRRG